MHSQVKGIILLIQFTIGKQIEAEKERGKASFSHNAVNIHCNYAVYGYIELVYLRVRSFQMNLMLDDTVVAEAIQTQVLLASCVFSCIDWSRDLFTYFVTCCFHEYPLILFHFMSIILDSLLRIKFLSREFLMPSTCRLL
jgi:hypothetical protein